MAILGRIAGSRIKELRKAKGWSQRDLALKSGIHYNQLGKYERGLQNIGDAALGKIAGALGCDITELVFSRPVSGLPTSSAGIRAGLRLQALRGERSFSKMKEITGVDAQHWAWYEEGVGSPSRTVAGKIAEGLGCTVEDILGSKTERDDPLLRDILVSARRRLLELEGQVNSLLEERNDLMKRIEMLEIRKKDAD